MRNILFLCGCVLSASAAATSVTLYDTTLGTTPDQQSWLALANNGAPLVVHDTLATVHDTTASNDIQAGYFSAAPFGGILQHPAMPVLDRNAGYRIDFDLQVLAESHVTRDDNGDGRDDRAGFSVIAINEDLSGLEIGFFEDRVWIYEDGQTSVIDLFTQSATETIAYDTSAETHYTLLASSTGYKLLADAVSILSGAWRNYNPSGLSGLVDPYDNPSFLFFGDDTTSAASAVRLGSIAVSSVPLPMPLWLLAGGMLGLVRKRRVRPIRREQTGGACRLPCCGNV